MVLLTQVFCVRFVIPVGSAYSNLQDSAQCSAASAVSHVAAMYHCALVRALDILYESS